MTRAFCAFAIALTIVGASARAAPPAAAVGLVPAATPAITEALADGARLAFERAAAVDGLDIELRVGSGPTHWGTASASAVELAFAPSVVALITPPDRATAHLVAQIGSRAHIPVLATTHAASIGGTGSYWVIPLVELVDEERARSAETEPATRNTGRGPQQPAFETAFRDRFGREPGAWAAVGYAAASALCDAVRDHGLDRRRIARELQKITPAAAR